MTAIYDRVNYFSDKILDRLRVLRYQEAGNGPNPPQGQSELCLAAWEALEVFCRDLEMYNDRFTGLRRLSFSGSGSLFEELGYYYQELALRQDRPKNTKVQIQALESLCLTLERAIGLLEDYAAGYDTTVMQIR